MKELYAVGLLNFAGDKFKDESIHIYEYSVRRYGYLAYTPLILYMVCKANKDGFAADKDIKRGFYTLGQALQYVNETYKLSLTKSESCPEVAQELPQVCQNCKWFLHGLKKCQLKDVEICLDPACIGCGLYESEE